MKKGYIVSVKAVDGITVVAFSRKKDMQEFCKVMKREGLEYIFTPDKVRLPLEVTEVE